MYFFVHFFKANFSIILRDFFFVNTFLKIFSKFLFLFFYLFFKLKMGTKKLVIDVEFSG